MRKPLPLTGLALLCLSLIFTSKSYSQVLNWGSSYSPAWADGNTNGTATSISGLSVNCTSSISISGGSFTNALGGSGAQTPTVSGATFTIPGSADRMQITPNFASNTNYIDIVMTFSAFITNVSFRIVDIDKNSSGSTTYFDRVAITGSDGTTTYNATLTKYDAVTDPNFLVISGNTANVNTTSGQAGNTASDAADQRGTINVSFGTANLNSITIHYDNAAGANSNPSAQAIGLGNVSFAISPTLPVSLTSFSGSQSANNVILKWTTVQEINTSSFVLERNAGNDWQAIASISARGNSNGIINYSYTDADPEKTILLYRLKQIDRDGNYKYSSVVRIANKGIQTEMTAYPNPFTSQVHINIYSAFDQSVTTIISDGMGKRIRLEVFTLYKGNNNISIYDLNKLTSGVYIIEVTDEERKLIGLSRLLKN